MRSWTRTAPLSEPDRSPIAERWDYRRDDAAPLVFEVDVFVGKPFDVAGLKGARLDETREYARFLAGTAALLYATPMPRAVCSICEEPLGGASVELEVFGVAYVRCPSCRHVLVRDRAVAGALDRIFAESEQHAATYVDTAGAELRIAQVAAPKLEWGLGQYRQRAGGTPRRILDVGAGGGHFLAAAARRGLAVEGFEASRVSRQFARAAFGIALRDDDFLTADLAAADLITMWGLLEYVAEPRAFLRRARQAIAPGGLLLVEVPRVDALGTRVQAAAGATVARHMDPTSHINAFSDASLCTALVEEGFAPVAAWYFGMDGWETLTQAALRLEDEAALDRLAPLLPALQAASDRGRQCDDLIVAALPSDRP